MTFAPNRALKNALIVNSIVLHKSQHIFCASEYVIVSFIRSFVTDLPRNVCANASWFHVNIEVNCHKVTQKPINCSLELNKSTSEVSRCMYTTQESKLSLFVVIASNWTLCYVVLLQ